VTEVTSLIGWASRTSSCWFEHARYLSVSTADGATDDSTGLRNTRNQGPPRTKVVEGSPASNFACSEK